MGMPVESTSNGALEKQANSSSTGAASGTFPKHSHKHPRTTRYSCYREGYKSNPGPKRQKVTRYTSKDESPDLLSTSPVTVEYKRVGKQTVKHVVDVYDVMSSAPSPQPRPPALAAPKESRRRANKRSQKIKAQKPKAIPKSESTSRTSVVELGTQSRSLTAPCASREAILNPSFLAQSPAAATLPRNGVPRPTTTRDRGHELSMRQRRMQQRQREATLQHTLDPFLRATDTRSQRQSSRISSSEPLLIDGVA